MIYIYSGIFNIIKILDKEYISNNIKRAIIIVNNKEYKLKENIEYCGLKALYSVKIKIKYLDIIINLNSMFKNCKSLSSIYNFKNMNTKYLKALYGLFYGCYSLTYIDDISGWNLNKVKNISELFYKCSSLKSLSDISKCNISNTNNISYMFYECSSLEELLDIGKWNTKQINKYIFFIL